MNIQFVGDPEPTLERLASGALDDPAHFERCRRETAARVRADMRQLRCTVGGSIRLFPHQERAVGRVVWELRGRAILADEVGLGKTIEAGMILKEYMLRGLVSRALVLVPPGLLGNWRAELARLGVGPLSDDFDAAGTGGVGVWLLSLARARTEPLAGQLAARQWDMLIVDEAHRLRDASSRSWRLVSAIRSRFLLLLTATPVQNDLKELFTLVTLLKPGQLSTYGAFRRRFMVDRHAVRDPDGLRRLLAEVMVRTTRRDTALPFPARRLLVLEAPLSSGEEGAYRAVLQLAREAYRRLGEDGVHLLPYVQLLRQVASHPRSGLPTVARLAAEREQDGAHPLGEHWPPIKRLREVAAALRRAPAVTGRMKVLGDWLAGVPGDEPIIVFTEFRRTQAWLARWLAACGVSCRLVHGGQDAAARAEAVEDVAGRGGVLISTDVGSEGHNWQWACTVVNFDLPWNPMRIEQRIGRVYRLGQTRDVMVANVVVPGTVEEYVVDLLHRKLGMFEQVIGDLDDVLGMDGRGWRRRLVDVILGSEDAADERRRVEALGEELASWRAVAAEAPGWTFLEKAL